MDSLKLKVRFKNRVKHKRKKIRLLKHIDSGILSHYGEYQARLAQLFIDSLLYKF